MDSSGRTGERPHGDGTMSPLTMFAWKAAIVATVCSVAVMLTTLVVTSIVTESVKGIRLGGSQFWHKVEAELEKAADPSRGMSPERKAKLIANIRALSDQWGPFLSEAYSAMKEGSAGRTDAGKK